MEYIDEARQEYGRMDYPAASVSQGMANMESLDTIALTLQEIDITLRSILKVLVERS